jgi:hypothetical protein
MTGYLYKGAKHIEKELAEKSFFRTVVLFVAAFNFVGFTIIPLINILFGENVENGIYVSFLHGVFLTVILIHFSKQARANTQKYFDNRVPAFLIALYVLTIIIVFSIKAASLLLIPYLATITVYNMQLMQLYIWPALSYGLFVWQLYILYSLSSKELAK